MAVPQHDPERQWRTDDRPAERKGSALKTAELILDALDALLDLLDAIF